MAKTIILILCTFFIQGSLFACSIVYYIDPGSGKIFALNNEDYWYDTKAYIQIEPGSRKTMARLWYGWKDFAQGGINEAGLFFDGAVTPDQDIPEGYHSPKGNLGDEILAHCKNVDEAISYLEMKKVALSNAHIFFGDATGNAVVIEWVNKEQKLIEINGNYLMATNFLISDSTAGNYPCPRYNAMKTEIEKLNTSNEPVNIKAVGNVLITAVQSPFDVGDGKIGGTLYSSFFNITDLEFILVYKLDKNKITSLDLKSEFSQNRKKRISLE